MSWNFVGSLQGPTGATGPSGPTGSGGGAPSLTPVYQEGTDYTANPNELVLVQTNGGDRTVYLSDNYTNGALITVKKVSANDEAVTISGFSGPGDIQNYRLEMAGEAATFYSYNGQWQRLNNFSDVRYRGNHIENMQYDRGDIVFSNGLTYVASVQEGTSYTPPNYGWSQVGSSILAYQEITTPYSMTGEVTSEWRTGVNTTGAELVLHFQAPASGVVYITLTGHLESAPGNVLGALMSYNVTTPGDNSDITLVNFGDLGRVLMTGPQLANTGSVTRSLTGLSPGQTCTIVVGHALDGSTDNIGQNLNFYFKSILVQS